VGLLTTIFVGVVLTAVGALQLLAAVQTRGFGTGMWGVLLGVFTLGAGLVLWVWPELGLATLGLVLGFYFTVQGMTQLMLGFEMRPDRGWIWMVVGGAVTSLLGAFVLVSSPLSAAWIVGAVVGVHLILVGWAHVAIAVAVRRFAGDVRQAVEEEPVAAA
jgi:uncharacterized membrane protein HdeD (DUF308 family)